MTAIRNNRKKYHKHTNKRARRQLIINQRGIKKKILILKSIDIGDEILQDITHDLVEITNIGGIQDMKQAIQFVNQLHEGTFDILVVFACHGGKNGKIQWSEELKSPQESIIDLVKVARNKVKHIHFSVCFIGNMLPRTLLIKGFSMSGYIGPIYEPSTQWREQYELNWIRRLLKKERHKNLKYLKM